MDTADKVTIKITAIDSLNSCWRDGHTTSFISSIVEDKKLFFKAVFSLLLGITCS